MCYRIQEFTSRSAESEKFCEEFFRSVVLLSNPSNLLIMEAVR